MAGPVKISPLSSLCAAIYLNLSKTTNYINLHETSGHRSAGPTGLIRSLIAQLLLSGITFSMDFICTRPWADEIQSHSLRTLCSTFRQLVGELSRTTTVVCIIDGFT